VYLILCADRSVFFARTDSADSGRTTLSAHFGRSSGVERKKVAPTDGAPPGRMRQEQLLEELQHDCCAWLDCERAAMPVCSSTLYWVIFATVAPISAF